jgi:hypothetical protein
VAIFSVTTAIKSGVSFAINTIETLLLLQYVKLSEKVLLSVVNGD